MSDKLRIGVLVSGGGTNLQSLIDSIANGKIQNAEIVCVISNKSNAYALERTRKHKIEALFINPKDSPDSERYSQKLADELKTRNVGLVCLAGFLLKLEQSFIRQFPGRIMNIHPALLPAFGGKGMYGHRVHEAVLDAGAKFSGCTIHFIDEIFDHGTIILQAVVPVLQDDTPETLAKRILEQEHKLYPEAVRLFASGKIKLQGRKCLILP